MLGAKQHRKVHGRGPYFSRKTAVHALRWTGGWAMIVLGVLGLFLPILQGVLFLIIGLILLAPYVPLFRKIRIRILLRYPKLHEKVLAHKRKRRLRKSSAPVIQVSRIVSGGQTGADRGGLDAAIACGVPHGGWCPKGRKAEDGAIDIIYELQETESEDYSVRTEENVRDSNATVVFAYGDPMGGSKLTAEVCEKFSKPCLVIDLDEVTDAAAAACIFEWLREQKVGDAIMLNVAGSRENEAPGIYSDVLDVMVLVLRAAV